MAEPLFMNANFKIGKKAFIFPEWITYNATTVRALVKEDGTFKTLNEIREECSFNSKPLEYFGCVSTDTDFARKKSIELNSNKAHVKSKVVSLLTSALRGAKPIYNAFFGEKEVSNACKA